MHKLTRNKPVAYDRRTGLRFEPAKPRKPALSERLRSEFEVRLFPHLTPLLEKVGLWAPPVPEALGDDVDPIAWAERFVAEMQAHGYALDFSLGSAKLIDQILDSTLFHDYNLVLAEARLSEGHPDRETVYFRQMRARHRLYCERETGAGAYIGEILRRNYGAAWLSQISPHNPLRNQYLNRIQLGEQVYHPSHYVSARLGGGRCGKGGLVSELLSLTGSRSQA